MLTRVQIPTPHHGGVREHNQLLVVHTSEGATTFASLGRFLQSTPRQVSYHVGFDNTASDKIGEFVKPPLESWSANGANHLAEHGCCCTPIGAAQHWTRSEWLKRPLMLEACRAWLQEESARYGIPLVKITPAQIKAGVKGVCGHKDCVDAGLGGNHTDPGPNFPWDLVCQTGDDDDMTQDEFNKLLKGALETTWGRSYFEKWAAEGFLNVLRSPEFLARVAAADAVKDD